MKIFIGILIIIISIILISCYPKPEGFIGLEEDGFMGVWGPENLQSERLEPTVIQLNWEDRAYFENGFIIDRRFDNDYWTVNYVILSANETTFIDSLIDWKKEFIEYRVYAYAGYEISGKRTITIPLNDTSPIGLNALAQEDLSVNLTWIDNSNGEDNFVVDKYIPLSGWHQQYAVLTENATFFNDSNINSFWGKYVIYAVDNGISSLPTDTLTISLGSQLYDYIDSYEARDIVIQDNLLFLADDDEGLKIFDISNPGNPVLIGNYLSDRAMGVYVKDSIVYLADYYDGFVLIDVTDPAQPFMIDYYYNTALRNVYVTNDYAFVTDNHEGLTIFNVTDPANIIYEGSYDTDNANHVLIENDIAYLTDSGEGLLILDISDVSSPYLLKQIDLPRPYDLCKRGDLLFVADWAYDLVIIDVSDYLSPQIVGCYQFDDHSYSLAVQNDLVYLTTEEGIKVIDISNMQIPVLVGECFASDAISIGLTDNYAYTANLDFGIYRCRISE